VEAQNELAALVNKQSYLLPEQLIYLSEAVLGLKHKHICTKDEVVELVKDVILDKSKEAAWQPLSEELTKVTFPSVVEKLVQMMHQWVSNSHSIEVCHLCFL
jgi:hypothetical protein